MHFPTAKCTSVQKMHFPAEKRCFRGTQGRKLQQLQEGFRAQESIGWEELTELSPRNSVRAKKLTEFGAWNRTLPNRIRPVSDFPSLQWVSKSRVCLLRKLQVPRCCCCFFFFFSESEPRRYRHQNSQKYLYFLIFWFLNFGFFEPGARKTHLPKHWGPSKNFPCLFQNDFLSGGYPKPSSGIHS